MPDDLEIVAELEREIGFKLPRATLEEGIPYAHEYRKGKGFRGHELSFGKFVHYSCVGYFADESGRVVGLALNNAGLETVPRSVLKLRNVRRLALDDNDLRTVPDGIGSLMELHALALQGNRLIRIPASVLQLRHLKTLYVGHNGITAIPETLGSLEELEELHLSHTGIESLPESISRLKNLRCLYAAKSRIKTLPRWLFRMGLDVHVERDPKTGILLYGNPLESPPAHVIRRGKAAVMEYFDSLEGEERLRLNEVKVLLVGDGGAGKTCLVKRLMGGGFDPHESQTHGINIDPWHVQLDGHDVKLHLWDFGGQEIMHATHQFFLSERSVYVLVLDGRKEQDAEYWLKHVESFGGRSPVLVVLNKMDEHPGFDVNRRHLKKKYAGIVDFYRVSCKSGEGIEAVWAGLNAALGQVEIVGTTWPMSWFRIKTRLEEMKQHDEHYIGLTRYREICTGEKLVEHGGQQTLVDFLSDLGVVVHFADLHLRDMHVLEPRWLTGAVYRIINSPILAENQGILALGSLDEILQPRDGDDFCYPADRHPYLVELMKKFELCYSLDERTVLVPDLLQIQEPEIEFDQAAALWFRIDYDFLPRSVMPRFIVRKHRDIVGDLRWRTGVVLEDPAFDARAVVKADAAARRIYIDVAGPQRRDYLTVIRSTFLDINRMFEKLDYVEKVPMPDEPEVTVSYKHLVRLEQRGDTDYLPDGSERSYDVKELLGTLHVEPKRTEEEFLQMLRSVMGESDTEKTLLEKADNLISMQPGFMGVTLNVNALIKGLLKRRRKS